MFDSGTPRFIRHFVSAYPARTASLIALLVLSGVAEALGVATLLPLLDTIGGTGESRSALATGVERGLALLGLTPSLATLLAVVVVAMVLKGAFKLLAAQQVGYTVSHVTLELRLDLLRALTRSSWPYFVKQPVGRFANAIGTEAARAANSYRSACALIATGIQCAAYFIIAVLVSWQTALLAIAAGGLIVAARAGLVAVSREAGRGQTGAMRALANLLTEALSGIKAIKAMGREQHLQPLLENQAATLNVAQKKMVLSGELLTAVEEPVLVAMLAIGIFVGVTAFSLPLGYVLMLGFLFYRLAGRGLNMQQIYQAIVIGETAFESLLDATNSALASAESTAGTLPPSFRREIVLDRITFAYDERPVLRDASLRIAKGEFLTLVGSSGSGKTTTIDLLIGFYQPQAGRILIDGVDLRELDLRAWRRFVGYVPQDAFLFHDTVRRNITLGDPATTDEQVWRALSWPVPTSS
jgi:ATP-binding cassette subfamily C protein